MALKSKIKSIIKFILNNIPARRYTVEVVNLAPNQLLKGRVALITGGTSGIGYHIAKAFLHSGAAVVITGRDENRLQQAQNSLNEQNMYNDKVFTLVMDSKKVASFEDCFYLALKKIEAKGYSKIDILVNNAGVSGQTVPFVAEEDYDNVMDTNLKGMFFISQFFGRYLKENKIEGNILNIGSASSVRPANSPYILSKWGVRSLTLGLAKSLLPYGITVNGIAPGPTATPMLLGKNLKHIENKANPLGRYALPEEIANMAVILVSKMGKTIIGDMVYMTGGAGIITYDDINYSF